MLLLLPWSARAVTQPHQQQEPPQQMRRMQQRRKIQCR
jgi:hypothetical protein